MHELWVANASPVIALVAGHLELLSELSNQLILPEAVAAEILAGPPSDPARQTLETGWGLRKVPITIPSELLEWGWVRVKPQDWR